MQLLDRKRALAIAPFWRLGFRPFFVAGALFALLAGRPTPALQWRGLPVRFAHSGDIPVLLGFRRQPAPGT